MVTWGLCAQLCLGRFRFFALSVGRSCDRQLILSGEVPSSMYCYTILSLNHLDSFCPGSLYSRGRKQRKTERQKDRQTERKKETKKGRKKERKKERDNMSRTTHDSFFGATKLRLHVEKQDRWRDTQGDTWWHMKREREREMKRHTEIHRDAVHAVHAQLWLACTAACHFL